MANTSTTILVLGASGQIGRLLIPKLIADGYSVVAGIRDNAKAAELERAGAEIRIADLEGELGALFEGIDIVIFTAGSGSSTGKDKTLTVDLWGAVQAIRASENSQVQRFIMVSALKAEDPNRGSEALKPYLVAKHAADEILKQSSLAYSILRPGRLTDGEERNDVLAASEGPDYSGTISRASVAEFIRQHIRNTEGNVVLDLVEPS
ncbi:MAG: SDR family oxidoreductase [Coraliomargarita sp.]